ncbi:MAG: threonine synthase [Elusimicrobiota bacterium]
MKNAYLGIINRYRKYLPVDDNTPVVTLYEGNTALIEAKNISKKLFNNAVRVFLKCEGFNPTGSFKDRGMTLAISKAVEEGSKAVICASTGNTSASAAAYSAVAGLKCAVLIPSGAIALGKLSQALMHGAVVVPVDGNFDVALTMVREIVKKYPLTLVNSLNPYRIEGQKTGAFEIVDFLTSYIDEGVNIFPDYQFMPVGNAGNITAYWKGYKEYQKLFGLPITQLPKMMGYQAAGSAPIVIGKPVEKPETLATAIRIGNPASWKQAVDARDESGGVIEAVTDDEIVEAYKLLAGSEGVFCEPASAASVAGLIKKSKDGYFKAVPEKQRGKKKSVPIAVCILTGHGLKDPERAIKSTAVDLKPVKPDIDAIIKAIGL